MKYYIRTANLPKSIRPKKKFSLINGFFTVSVIISLLTSGPAAAFGASASSLAASYVTSDYTTDNLKEAENFHIYVNGTDKTNTFSNPIYVSAEGRTLLPLRDLGNLPKCDVQWDSAEVAVIKSGSTTVEVPIGSRYIIVNGAAVQIDEEGTKAVIVGEDYTYLPFRSISEALGFNVDYKTGADDSKNIYLTASADSKGYEYTVADGSMTITLPSEDWVCLSENSDSEQGQYVFKLPTEGNSTVETDNDCDAFIMYLDLSAERENISYDTIPTTQEELTASFEDELNYEIISFEGGIDDNEIKHNLYTVKFTDSEGEEGYIVSRTRTSETEGYIAAGEIFGYDEALLEEMKNAVLSVVKNR